MSKPITPEHEALARGLKLVADYHREHVGYRGASLELHERCLTAAESALAALDAAQQRADAAEAALRTARGAAMRVAEAASIAGAQVAYDRCVKSGSNEWPTHHCRACNGEGTVDEDEDCDDCGGDGYEWDSPESLTKDADLAAVVDRVLAETGPAAEVERLREELETAAMAQQGLRGEAWADAIGDLDLACNALRVARARAGQR